MYANNFRKESEMCKKSIKVNSSVIIWGSLIANDCEHLSSTNIPNTSQ